MFKIYSWCVIFLGCVYCTSAKEPKIISLWQDFPLKFLMNLTSVQPECRIAYTNFANLLNNNDLNALKMLDATAKLPSGIMSGNVVQYGDFDECMEVPSAQYCLAEIDLEPLWKEPYSDFKHLVHSFYFFKGTFDDPAHRIPDFAMIRWGFCIPRECSSSDLQQSLKDNIGVPAQIRPGMCQKTVNDTPPLTLGDYLARIFFGTIAVALVVSSLIDYLTSYSNKERNNGAIIKLLMCFSLKQNLSKLFEMKEDNSSEIAGLHGIRALNALALFMSHKAVSLFFNPFVNRTATINTFSKSWAIVGKNAIVYTDSFMLLSGLLNANALLTDLYNRGALHFKDKLINRIFRILPNVIALILFCTYILPPMGSGPLWPTIVNHHSTLCKHYMWRNLLFIHNYFGFENMCLTHTHQLGIDMQLFLITPILVYLIWRNKRTGFLVLIFMSLTSTFLRFWVVYENELSTIIYFGIPTSKMFSTTNLTYILPAHRATIYLVGVSLAYLLKFSKRNVSFNKMQVACLWLFFLPIFLWSWLGSYHMVQKDFVYNKLEAALIAAFAPILWGVSLSFGIYAVNKNIAGWFGEMLCWRHFQVVTKLTYAIYLVQFPVFFYNVGMTKSVVEYQSHFLLPVFEGSAVVFFSLILVLLIEMPFQNMKTIIFPKKIIDKEKILFSRLATERKKFKSG